MSTYISFMQKINKNNDFSSKYLFFGIECSFKKVVQNVAVTGSETYF